MSTMTWVGGLPGPYNLSTPSNWTGGVPGPGDVGMLQNPGSTGLYTLTGSLTLGELAIVGDIASLKGTILASGSLSTDLAVTGGGAFTIASTGNVSGGDIIQVGSTATAGVLDIDGILNTGQVDVLSMGTLAIDAHASLTGDIALIGGSLQSVPVLGGTAAPVTLANAIHLVGSGTATDIGTGLTLTGAIDGTGSLFLFGGDVTLSGANTFSGGVEVGVATTLTTTNGAAVGSGSLTLDNRAELIAAASQTIAGALLISLSGSPTIAAAHNQTLSFVSSATAANSFFGSPLVLGAPGADGTIVFHLHLSGLSWSTAGFTVQAGTVVDDPIGLINGFDLGLNAGTVFDLHGANDAAALGGSGVLTNSGTAASFQLSNAAFSGTIEGAVITEPMGASNLLGGTIAATVAGTIASGNTLDLVNGGSIVSAMQTDGALVGAGTASVTGLISGAGSILVIGGSLTLSGVNAFTGGVTVTGGTLVPDPTALGSGTLAVAGGMLLATTSGTIANPYRLLNAPTIAAAHGQTLLLDGHGASVDSAMTFGAPGADGVVSLNTTSTFSWGSTPSFIVAAGTLQDSSAQFVRNLPVTIEAGATFDLAGISDTAKLSGSGVVTDSTMPASLLINGGSFAGTITGPVAAVFQDSPFLAGTIAASAAGTILSASTLNLVGAAAIASAIEIDGTLVGQASGTATVSGPLSGTGKVVQINALGRLILTGDDSYAGGTTIDDGVLQIGNFGTIGSITGDVDDAGIAAVLAFARSDAIVFDGNITGAGLVEQLGSGTLLLGGTNTFSGGIIAFAGGVELGNSSAAGSGEVLLGAATTLRLDTNILGNTIAFNVGNTIDLAALPFSGPPTFTYDGTTLDVIATGTTVALSLPGTFTAASFSGFSDGHGGTAIIACFAAGTRIATPGGEVPVEKLRVGDCVLVGLRDSLPPLPSPTKLEKGEGWMRDEAIVAIHRRTIDCAHHPNPCQVWPVRIAAGAFGKGRPSRDLLLSPDHAVFCDGVLIPAKHLVNGTTIVRQQVNAVTYYHIELPRHDLLFAEGLAVESFLPARASVSLSWEADACAPLVVTGPILATVQRHLKRAAHAEQPGPHPHHPHRQPAASRRTDRALHPSRTG